VTDGGGRVRVGSQATGFAAAPTPTLPQVLAVAGVSSKKGLPSFTVKYNEPLSSSSARKSGEEIGVASLFGKSVSLLFSEYESL
jgi:hypothetical protein